MTARTKKFRLYIVLGFQRKLLHDTLATSRRESKRICVNSLWRNHPEYEREQIGWPEIEKWGWKCVPVTVTVAAADQKQARIR